MSDLKDLKRQIITYQRLQTYKLPGRYSRRTCLYPCDTTLLHSQVSYSFCHEDKYPTQPTPVVTPFNILLTPSDASSLQNETHHLTNLSVASYWRTFGHGVPHQYDAKATAGKVICMMFTLWRTASVAHCPDDNFEPLASTKVHLHDTLCPHTFHGLSEYNTPYLQSSLQNNEDAYQLSVLCI